MTEIPIIINPIVITVPITIPAPISVPIQVGQTGFSAKIAKSYESVALMMEDIVPTGIAVGQNAIISSVDSDNGKLYRWDGDGIWTFLAQLQGPQGPAGQNFTYSKTYSSVAEMQADNPPEGVPEGGFVIISSTVEDPDNAKVYVYFNGNFSFIADLSGSQGAIGNPGEASYLYVQSRGQGLISNGSGLLGNNYNFTGFIFDQVEVSGGYGSFRVNLARATKLSDEFIPINPIRKYLLSGVGKSGDEGGENYNPSNIQYFGIALYDIDGNIIDARNSSKYTGSTDTVLATQLNVGDSVINLSNSTGWFNGSSPGYDRNFCWWPYVNSKGYSYQQYTYTRNLSDNVVTDYLNGAWAAGGISGNTISLRYPWPGPSLPAGTPVRNIKHGNQYKYIALNNSAIPNTWTSYSGTIQPADGSGLEVTGQWRAGTVKVKLLFLINYHNLADNNVRWCNLDFGSLQSIT